VGEPQPEPLTALELPGQIAAGAELETAAEIPAPALVIAGDADLWRQMEVAPGQIDIGA
jgi:hypothetical protein